MARIEEECRDTRRVAFVHNLAQDLRYTLRSLARQPLLVMAATVSIAVAVGANTTIFTLARNCVFDTVRQRDPDRSGPHQDARQQPCLLSPVAGRCSETDALSGLAGYQIEVEVNWRAQDQSVSLIPLIVTANFFDVLGAPLAMGRGFTSAEADAERHPDVAVISHAFWQKRLGGDGTDRGQKPKLQRPSVYGARCAAGHVSRTAGIRRRAGGVSAAQPATDA